MSDLRTVLHSAYTFIRSVEVNKATAALTLDHMIQDQINRLQSQTNRAILGSKGENLGDRISYIDTLDALQKQMQDIVTAIQNAGNDPDKLTQLGLDPDDQTTLSSGSSSSSSGSTSG